MAFSLILRVRILLFIIFICVLLTLLTKQGVEAISSAKQPFGHAHTLSVFYTNTADTDDRLCEYDTVKAVRASRQDAEKPSVSIVHLSTLLPNYAPLGSADIRRLPATSRQLQSIKLRQLIPKHHFW